MQEEEAVQLLLFLMVSNAHVESILKILNILCLETSQEVVDKVMSNLKKEGFDCYQTSVGGSGANATILSGNENEYWLLNASRSELEKYL